MGSWPIARPPTRSRLQRPPSCTRLVEAIKTLGDQERVVTTFYFYEGLTLREIGGALDLTEGRISQILHRALAKLRKVLAESPQFSGRL
ncbi:MAG: sigma-70 family RNA polymerase sigma factor [Actinomycetota bacterium]|nr:sigma-70 family RNA polymerase sigma factor [Actinomycetota bacterium]